MSYSSDHHIILHKGAIIHPGIIMIADEDAPHGDWKTQSVREEYMGLKKGEKAVFVKVFVNFYGRYFTLRRADGTTCDVEPRHVSFTSDPLT